MIWLLAGTILPRFVVAWLLGFVIRGRAAQWGLIDRPAERKNHANPTPMGGGLAIWAGVLFPLLSGLVALTLVSRFSQGDLEQCRQLLGDGALAELVAPRARSVTCLDASARVVAAGRRRLKLAPSVRFTVGDMHDLPFPAERFDQLMLVNSLSYAERPELVVKEAARVLRPAAAWWR